MDLQLFVDVFQMEGDGIGRNAHGAGGRLMLVLLDQQFEQLGFVRGQMVSGARGRAKLTEQRHHAAGDVRRHRRTAVNDLAQRFQQPRRRRVLKQITGRAGTSC